jgi:CBS domain containing-hemolysin-like protein
MSIKLHLHAVPDALQLRSPMALARPATLASPAIDLLTDFRQSPIVTVPDSLPIDRALEVMIMAGVRFCFAVTPNHRMVGNITSYDIQGERPLGLSHGSKLARTDIHVRDIMEPLESWQVIDFDEVKSATVGDVIEAFKQSGRRHLVVVERLAGTASVRGLLSASRVEAAIDRTLEIYNVPDTFAEIERALEHR